MQHVAIKIHNYLYTLNEITCSFLESKNISCLFQTYILVIICLALGFVGMIRKAWVEKGVQICVTTRKQNLVTFEVLPLETINAVYAWFVEGLDLGKGTFYQAANTRFKHFWMRFEVETKGISTTNLQWVPESGFITVVWICFPWWILRAAKAFGCPSLTIWFCHFLVMLCCFFCQIKFTGILPCLTETWTAWIFQRKASIWSNRTGFLNFRGFFLSYFSCWFVQIC